MKKTFIFIGLFSIMNNSFSQTIDSLSTSILEVTLNTDCPWFSKGCYVLNPIPGFAAEESFIMYASNIWFSAKDVNDNLYSASETYRRQYSPYDIDYQFGPVMNNSADYPITTQQFRKLWRVNRGDIYYHQNNFSNAGYVIPSSILDWPGNAPIGAAGGANLAPYFDFNTNGVYDPENGDFPLIKGDEAIYFIKNDDTTHTSTGSPAMKLETHVMVYKFNCPSDELLENTIFMDITLYNRGITSYFGTTVGIWVDFDLGFAEDDFIGTDVENGMFYVYNADAFDDAGGGQPGYGNSPPAAGVVFLAGPSLDNDGVDNPMTDNINDCITQLGIPYANLGYGYGDGIIDNERMGLTGAMMYYRDDQTPIPSMGEPNNSTDFHRYLNGFWQDGTPFYFGGSGHQSDYGAMLNGLVQTYYHYPDNSDSLNWSTRGIAVANSNSWNEILTGNTPSDRRMMGSSGTFTFAPGQKEELSIAYVYSRDTITSAFPSLNGLRTKAAALHQCFKADSVSCYPSFTVGVNEEIKQNKTSFLIYPNPATDVITLKIPSELMNSFVEIYDSFGRLVYTGRVASAQTELSISGLSSGYYLVKLSNDKYTSLQKLSVAN